MCGLNDPRTRQQTVYFSGLITSVFNAVRFDGNTFTRQCEKESKNALGFQQGLRFRTFIGRFRVTSWQ